MASASGFVHPASQNMTVYVPGGTSGTRKEALAGARFDSEPPITTRPTRKASARPTAHQFRGEAMCIARSTIE
jgi:hypothetical protein